MDKLPGFYPGLGGSNPSEGTTNRAETILAGAIAGTSKSARRSGKTGNSRSRLRVLEVVEQSSKHTYFIILTPSARTLGGTDM